MRVKFCGMTSAAEVALAVEAGADAIGAILAESPRRVTYGILAEIGRAVPPFVTKVAVLDEADAGAVEAARANGFVLQMCGSEPPRRCDEIARGGTYLRVLRIPPAAPAGMPAALAGAWQHHPSALLLFDTAASGGLGGSGVPFDWEPLAALAQRRRIAVAGGLTPENVGACVLAVRPFAVDVRSGIESDGRKDPAKMQAFVAAVRAAR